MNTDTATNSENIIAVVEDLTVAYDVKPVLWDIDLKIPQGRLMAIVGPNGAGKTTLIKAMLNLIKPVSGSVKFWGETNLKSPLLRNRIGYVPQSGSVDWDFPATVKDIALMGAYGKIGWFKRPKKSHMQKAMDTLEKVGMADYADRQISPTFRRPAATGFSCPCPCSGSRYLLHGRTL